MASEKEVSVNLGGGFFGIMFLIFMTLKLCNIIDWSWWWVAAPLWIPASLGLTLFVLAVILFLIFGGKK